jgi:hypothetical protein
VVPVLRWIGPFLGGYIEIPAEGFMPLSEKDELKAFSLLSKPFMSQDLGKISQQKNEL